MNQSFSLDFIPILVENVEINPFDSSSKADQFLLISEGRVFNISENVVCLIELISLKISLSEIIQRYNKNIQFAKMTLVNLNEFLNTFLLSNNLLQNGKKDSTHPQEEKLRRGDLTFKFEILKKETIFPISNKLKILFNSKIRYPFYILYILLTLVFFSLSYSQINLSFITSLSASEYFYAYLFMIATMFVHEIGHASASRYLGVEHDDIGMGIYKIFFVLYTDVTYCWKLDRKDRILVNIGGMYFQTIFLIVLQILYLFTPSNFLFVLILWEQLSLVTSLNPFIKLDGYWIISDSLGIPNLSKKVYKFSQYIRSKIFLEESENPFLDIKQKQRYLFYIYSSLTIIVLFLALFYFLKLTPDFYSSYFYLIKDTFFQIDTVSTPTKSIFSETVTFLLINFFIFMNLRSLIPKLILKIKKQKQEITQ